MKKNILFIINVLLAFFVLGSNVLAETFYVGPEKDFADIQSAINFASSGDKIIVSEGLYKENINYLGKNISLTSTDPDNSTIVESTVIDAEGNGTVVSFMNSETTDAILSGFTIRGGVGSELEGNSNSIIGGGILCMNASPTIRKNIISGNHGPTDENTLVNIGAGIACVNSNAIITQNTITGNTTYGAGAIYVSICNPIITNNIIHNNSATYIGGVYMAYGGILVNNTIIDNNATQMGGNICAIGDAEVGSFIIENNIVCNASQGSGIYVQGDSIDYSSIRFNNVWNNNGSNYENLPDQTGINGNISSDPGFIDLFHISNSSPCFDAGNPSYVPYLWQLDIDGEAAVMNFLPDIGADEVTGVARPVADAGNDQYHKTIPTSVILDGSGSFDLNPENTLIYTWIQTGGPSIDLINPESMSTSFIPNTEGVYLFQLTVNNGFTDSYFDEIMVVVGNRLPIADAGEDLIGEPGDTIVLNGINSYDLDANDHLNYSWTQISGSSVEMVNINTAQPYFVASYEGEFIFELIVDDGIGVSQPDAVAVTIQAGSVYDEYGYQWIDNDSKMGPRFHWIDICQSGVEVTGLTDDNHVGPFPIGFNFNFYGNVYSEFYVQSNGLISFSPGTIDYNNTSIPLNDTNNNIIAWLWDDLTGTNSKVYFKNYNGYTVIQFVDYHHLSNGSVNAEVILYESGRVIIQYKDFTDDFYSNNCTIGIENIDGSIGTQVVYRKSGYLHDNLAIEFSFGPPYQPVAVAGIDQQVLDLQLVSLDGGMSYDRDTSDVLTYQWVQISGPPVELSDPTVVDPTFLPETESEYKFQLTVSDGVMLSYPDEVIIVVGNRMPVADAGSDKLVQIGTQVYLNGTRSYDLDISTSLSYSWTQIDGPVVELQQPETDSPYFECVEEGVYNFRLVVDDGHKQSLEDIVKFTTVDISVTDQVIDLANIGTYAHYGDVSGEKVVYGVGDACDYTWRPRYKNLISGNVSAFDATFMQPKIDGDLIVWMQYGSGWDNPWTHEPCNSSVYIMNLNDWTQRTLRRWSWSDSYGHPVISGTKVIWMEHHDLDPRPTDSSEANNWWNTPFSICGADVSNLNNPIYFTIDENVGRHDPYPCLSYSSDFDDVVDVCNDIVVWEADGDIYGADISDIDNIKLFAICSEPGRQYDPAISGNTVIWTDERNDGGDIYGADISNIYNIKIFEVVREAGSQQQAAIDGSLIVYVDMSTNDNNIRFCYLTNSCHAIDILLDTQYTGIGPAIDSNNIIWQSDTYGEALGVSLNVNYYYIANGPIVNINSGKRYDCIQHAINDSVNGDIIEVEPGVYHENINFMGKNIIVRSCDPMSNYVVATTVIQGHGNTSVVTFAGTEDMACKLSGFTITEGYTCIKGAGIDCNESQAVISNCIIKNNNADNCAGGGIWGNNGIIENCIIKDNVAGFGGAIAKSNGIIRNTLVFGNIASRFGSAIHNCDSLIQNCTIVGSSVADQGLLSYCDGLFENCILDCDSEFMFYNNTAITTYCCYQNADGEGDINTDPSFVNPQSDDYYLLIDSPCINTGNPNTVLILDETDIDGSSRKIGPNVDIGAYEFDASQARISLSSDDIHLYVSDDTALLASDSLYIANNDETPINWEIMNDCSWLSVTPPTGEISNGTSQVDISVNASGLYEGVYRCTLNLYADNTVNSNKAIDIVLHVDRTVIYVPSQCKKIQDAIMLCNDGDSIVVSPGTYEENIHIGGKNFILSSIEPSSLDVVSRTIIKGTGNDSVVCFNGTETEKCVISGVTITGGYSLVKGAGIDGNGAHAGISNCIIQNNSAYGCAGGGIWGIDGDIVNCIIRNNHAAFGGGIAKCTGIIKNTLLYDNVATTRGYAINNCDGIIQNCTLIGTDVSDLGLVSNCDGIIQNCILSFEAGQLSYNNTATLRYCCYPGATGDGNIDVVPMFIDSANNNYHLLPESPCIDSGDPTFDFSNEPLPNGGCINIGAYGNTVEAAQSSVGFVVLGFEIISKKSIEDTIFEYELAIRAYNSNLYSINDIQLRLIDFSPAVLQVNDNVVNIVAMSSKEIISSQNTFSIILNKSIPVSDDKLTWELTCSLVGSDIPVHTTLLTIPISKIDSIPGDITGEGDVNLLDIAQLFSQWQKAPDRSLSADIASPLDNFVGEEDLLYLIDNWLNASAECISR